MNLPRVAALGYGTAAGNDPRPTLSRVLDGGGFPILVNRVDLSGTVAPDATFRALPAGQLRWLSLANCPHLTYETLDALLSCGAAFGPRVAHSCPRSQTGQ